jgi:hypothetical protein
MRRELDAFRPYVPFVPLAIGTGILAAVNPLLGIGAFAIAVLCISARTARQLLILAFLIVPTFNPVILGVGTGRMYWVHAVIVAATVAAVVAVGVTVLAVPRLRRVAGLVVPFAGMLVIALLVFTYIINNLTGVGTTIVRALGVPRYESYYAVVGAGLNIGATLALAPRFGILGVLLGTAVGSTLGSVYFLWLFHRLRQLSLWSALGRWLWRLSLATALAGASVWWAAANLPVELFADRAHGLATLSALGLLYLVALTACLALVGFIEPADLAFARQTAPQPLVAVADRLRLRPAFRTQA